MKKTKIAILDSGVKSDHPAFINSNVSGFCLNVVDGIVKQQANFTDNIGHGTAIFYIIDKMVENAEITNIKIFDTNTILIQQDLEQILEYMYNHFEFDIINISMGFVCSGSVQKIQTICNNFYKKGTIIVSAFDNNGAVSFPAALDNVIGVDCIEKNPSLTNFIHIENSIVNIVGKAHTLKVAWINPDYILIKGNSFLCAEITAKIAKILQDDDKFDFDKICSSKKTLRKTSSNDLPFSIKKAAIFPFNKEIHALARFENLLDFEIENYYSQRITGLVGKHISTVLTDCKNNRTIKNVDDISWDNFDTLILGHTTELHNLTKKEYGLTLINTAIEKGKNVFAFDTTNFPDEYKKNLYSRTIDNNIIGQRFGKFYKTDKPILAIVGTNSKQGKFSLQLSLRHKFSQRGYSVGQLGTEPSSQLFGFDETFPCGYQGQINLTLSETYMAINEMIWKITQKDIDLIITGCQSGLLAYNDYNIQSITSYHQIVFSAMQPDAIIICVNPYDDLDFVNRTIKTAEGLSGGKVIGIVCFPIDKSQQWTIKKSIKTRISSEQENELKNSYKGFFSNDTKLYMLDSDDDMEQLVSTIISFFQ